MKSRNLHLLLGLPAGTPFNEVKKQYTRLIQTLFDEPIADGSLSRRLQTARERLSQAYEAYKADPSRKGCGTATAGGGTVETAQAAGDQISRKQQRTKPKLGQILVAAGLITLEDLNAALALQNESTTRQPIGQILLAQGKISEEQLNYYLKLQEVVTVSPHDTLKLSVQMLELGLMTEDQVAIAKLDQRTQDCSFSEAVMRRGWIPRSVMDRLTVHTMLPSIRANFEAKVC